MFVELEELIRPTGFYRNKASSLIGLGQALVELEVEDLEAQGLRRPQVVGRGRQAGTVGRCGPGAGVGRGRVVEVGVHASESREVGSAYKASM